MDTFTTLGVGLIILLVVVAFILLFVVDFGLALIAQELSAWRERKRMKDQPTYPWTDRTGTKRTAELPGWIAWVDETR
jgi:hypothetical protein